MNHGVRATVVAVLAACMWHCSGQVAPNDGGDVADVTPGDAQSVDAMDGGPLACGAMTCGATQACVVPCCGGACFRPGDAGCPGDGSVDFLGCCQCTPEPPHCVDVPPACGSTLTCGCFTTPVCGGSCDPSFFRGRSIHCICA